MMAIDGDNLAPADKVKIYTLNYLFNSVFILEFIVKVIGLGPISNLFHLLTFKSLTHFSVYFSDTFNYLDTLIVVFSLVEISTDKYQNININPFIKTNSIDLSQLSILKVFRIFRVFRLAKVLRRVKAMRNIIIGINRSISNILYTVALLFLFIIIYVLLGMSLLTNIEDMNSFINALYVVFQTLSMENWNFVLTIYYP